ncbi:hypothetical protein AALP_AA5G106300 [Arabis alpina]|uniref:Uncharacterized protein n=1 Tax=Arabis alpina TaxID=50452 RepID=A0A087GW91_ARAAL|nr:hypothetical protein AALP_AA5G106300 [Arabis alpina]
MANWSLDSPILTDRFADEIHMCTHGETSLNADIRNQEGLGNDFNMESVLNFKRSREGIVAVASTVNSLKVLVEFLTSPAVEIPVRALDVGTITPVEIRKACRMNQRKRKFFTILALEADVTPEASQLAVELSVKVICGHVLEDLCRQYEEYGLIKVGVPISILRGGLDIGHIAWIEKDQQPVEVATLGETVIIKIVASNEEEQGREIVTSPQQHGFICHFDMGDILVTRLSRKSINALKSNYRDVLSMSDWKLVSDLKYVFKIE